jgi:hypothetical protein
MRAAIDDVAGDRKHDLAVLHLLLIGDTREVHAARIDRQADGRVER